MSGQKMKNGQTVLLCGVNAANILITTTNTENWYWQIVRL